MKKDFDCVEMKNRIQQKMLEEEERFGIEEMARRRREWLWNSDDPLAVWWRSVAGTQDVVASAPVVREDPPDWNTEKKS